MTPPRALLVAFAVAFAAVTISSGCGGKAACTASSCSTGCCDSSGTCQLPSNTFCGQLGAACSTCQAGQFCQLGVCQGSGGTGGGSSGGGGGSSGGGGGTMGGGGGSTGGGGGTMGGGGGTTGGGGGTVGGGGGTTGGGGGTTGGGGGTTGGGGGTTGGGGGSVACDATSCPSGCCDGAGVCQAGTANSACGIGGTRCEPCFTGTSCQNKACIASPPSNGLPGAGCTSDSNCLLATGSGTGESQSCIPALEPDGGASGFVGGYCNPSCTGMCVGGTCLGIFGGNYCLANCAAPNTGQSTCRPGYVCEPITVSGAMAPFGVCFPNCNNAGSGCGTTGTCQANGHCQ